MDTLILGGLIVIGLLAVVGLVLVLRSGRPRPEMQTEQPAPATSEEVEPPDHGSESDLATAPQAQPALMETSDALPGRNAERPAQRMILNGQFHELAQSVRALRQDASEITQRLDKLTSILDTIEHKQHEDES